MRNFLWRAFRDACVTKFNLFRRRCASSPLCPICAEGEKTMEHILLFCPWTSRVWNGGPLSLQVNRNPITTLADWLCLVVNQNLGCKENLDRTMSHVVFSCWFIWRARCDDNKVYPSHFRTLRAIATSLDSFKMASTTLRLLASDRINHSRGMHHSPLWSPPPVNWIKLNVDAC